MGVVILDFIGGPNGIRRVLVRWRQEGQSQRDLKILCFKDGGRGYMPKNVGDL